MKRSLPGLAAASLAVIALLVMAPRIVSQATPYVSLQDPAYRDLDVLVTSGLVRYVILAQRPYSRAVFACAAAEARARVDAAATLPPKPRIGEALQRLEERFAAAAAPSEGATDRGLLVHTTWADSPARSIKSRYEGHPDRIDADLAPLLQRNQGRRLADGGTLAVEGWADGRLGSRFAYGVHPRASLAVPASGDAHADLEWVRGYARAVLGNLSVDLGRNQVTRGHARELGVAFSGNARGLDMVRLSMDHPTRLPWVFQHLGAFELAGTLAMLGRDRDNPGGVLVVWEGSLRPHRNFELGLTLLNQQGGDGAPDATLGDRIRDAFFLIGRPIWSLPPDKEISDKLVGMDARLTLPGPGVEVFLEGITTDDHNFFYYGPREAFWNEAAWTGGVRAFGLGASGRWDLWAELGRNGVRPYTHHQYTSGLTLDRRILGSPLGPLATGLQAGADWTGPSDRVSLSGAWERYSGDEYYHLDGGATKWLLESDNPDEIRLRATLDWERAPAVTGLYTSVRLGYERVTRFAFTDRDRSNFLAQVGVGWRW